MIDFDRISISKLSESDDLSSFDATEEDGTDPGGLQEFIQLEALQYQRENLGVTYLFKLEGQIVAFSTLAMSSIKPGEISPDERVHISKNAKVPKKAIRHDYPSLLLGRLAVNKEWRGKHLSIFVIKWVVGMAVEFCQKLGCRYICLHCRPNRITLYQEHGFRVCEVERAESPNQLMYRKIVCP